MHLRRSRPPFPSNTERVIAEFGHADQLERDPRTELLPDPLEHRLNQLEMREGGRAATPANDDRTVMWSRRGARDVPVGVDARRNDVHIWILLSCPRCEV